MNVELRKKITNKSNLYFIIIDQNMHVFGHYYGGRIDRSSSNLCHRNTFMFTMNNGRGLNSSLTNEPLKFFNSEKGSTMFYSNKQIFSYGVMNGNEFNPLYSVCRIGSECSFVSSEIEKHFEGLKASMLTDQCYPEHFTAKRIIVMSATQLSNFKSITYSSKKLTVTDLSQLDVNGSSIVTFYGDYITSDNKVLTNIKATLVGGRIANAQYSSVNTNRIIYAGYKIDENTHRAIAPLASTEIVNILVNRVTDLFIQNLEDIAIPIILYQKGTINANKIAEIRKKRQCEFNAIENKPEFYTPPQASTNGLQLMDMILNQSKNVLGLNNYMAGNTDGAVRTARESAILTQKANARMRVETDVFSYNFMLSLFVSFYAFNRELALSLEEPLDEIYADPKLRVAISTNASRADKEGELQRLMQMLQLPIAQMIFSNLQPDQVVLAVRYLMAKAELTDADNLLELIDEQTGQTNVPDNPDINNTQPMEESNNNK